MSRAPARWLPALLAALALAGCTGFFSMRFPDPRDFAQHARDADYFELHWNYHRPRPDLLEATGLIINRYGPPIKSVTLELVSFDPQGKLLNRRTATPPGPPLYRFDGLPFTIRLPLNGGEASFLLRVHNYDYFSTPA